MRSGGQGPAKLCISTVLAVLAALGGHACSARKSHHGVTVYGRTSRNAASTVPLMEHENSTAEPEYLGRHYFYPLSPLSLSALGPC